MVSLFILSLSVALQFLAAGLALRLIKVTGNRLGWILLAVAVFLMAVRRSIPLGRAVFGRGDFPYQPDLAAELVALGISICMVVGLALIDPLFRSIKESKDELRRRAIRQEVMAKLGQHALATKDIPVLMDEAVSLVRQTLDVEYCKVLELLPGGKEFLLKAGVGWKEGCVGQSTVGAGLDSQAGYTLLKESPLIVEDLRTETRFTGPPLLQEHGVVSGISVIIQGKDQPFGVLGVHTTTHRAFCQDDVNFLQNVANVLAEAIQREESEAKVRLLFNSAAEGIYAIDLEGRCTFCNPACVQLLGYSESSELVGQNMHGLIHHSYADGGRYPRERCPVCRSLRENANFHADDDVFWRRDGSCFAVEYWSHTLHQDGELIGSVVTFVDITKRRTAEQALRESEERYRLVMEAAPSGMIVVDKRGIITLVNQVTESFFGYAREQLIGQPIERLVPERFRTRHRSHRISYSADPTPRFMGTGPELVGLRQDGSEFPLEIRLDPINTTDGELVLASIIDVTERKQNEKQLRELYRRLGATEESERQKISREVHDEFGQLLTALKMDIGWLSRELDMGHLVDKERFSEKLADTMMIVNRAIQSVRRITTQLRPVMLDTLGLIPALEWLASDFEERTGISCDVAVCESLLDIPVDAEHATAIFRIAQEFLTNVARHANASAVRFTIDTREGWRVLDMKDNGVGISPDRVHSTATLGLLGMKERAEMLGGRFAIEGKAGEGTHATVALPV